MTKNNLEVISLSALGSFGILKLTQTTVDPFTRFAAGVLVGAAMATSPNRITSAVGIGIAMASVIQLMDLRKGGRLTFNNASKKVFILDEEAGVFELSPLEIPPNYIDGITVEGMNGVFKIANGVYAGVGADNTIKCSPGLGAWVNARRDGGFKKKNWVDTQNDRWKSLYEKSV